MGALLLPLMPNEASTVEDDEGGSVVSTLFSIPLKVHSTNIIRFDIPKISDRVAGRTTK